VDLLAIGALGAASFTLALSGALAPGPMFFATIAGSRRRGFWFGPGAVLGHALAELPVVALLLVGLSAVLENDSVLAGIGAIGAAALLWMAAGMLRQAFRQPPEEPSAKPSLAEGDEPLTSPRREAGDAQAAGLPPGRTVESQAAPPAGARPRALVVEAAGAGFVTSLLNPYWHLWWVTQPTLLLASAAAQGWPGVGAFFAGHISADLLWYSLTSYGISRGRNLLAGRVYQGLLIGCAAMLLMMAALFAALVIQKLAGPTGA
jgi:threonine/homoserine/homoserine lactone efflux protein